MFCTNTFKDIFFYIMLYFIVYVLENIYSKKKKKIIYDFNELIRYRINTFDNRKVFCLILNLKFLSQKV